MSIKLEKLLQQQNGGSGGLSGMVHLNGISIEAVPLTCGAPEKVLYVCQPISIDTWRGGVADEGRDEGDGGCDSGGSGESGAGGESGESGGEIGESGESGGGEGRVASGCLTGSDSGSETIVISQNVGGSVRVNCSNLEIHSSAIVPSAVSWDRVLEGLIKTDQLMGRGTSPARARRLRFGKIGTGPTGPGKKMASKHTQGTAHIVWVLSIGCIHVHTRVYMHM